MQTGGAGFATAVAAQDRRIAYKVTIGFPAGVQASYQNVTRCVVSYNIDRSVSTGFNEQTTLIAGSASAQATVVLAGCLKQNAGVPANDSQTIAWLMNPHDTTSPMYRTTRAGLSVVVQEGVWDGATSADLVTKFTGTIDTVSISNGVVTLTCRDQRSTITNQATLPPVITQAPANAGLTSEFAVDWLLRHSSPSRYYSWPKLRSNCLGAAGMRSSIWPEVGSYDNGFVQVPNFVAGEHGSLASLGVTQVYNLSAPITPAAQGFIQARGKNGFLLFVGNDALTYAFSLYVTGTGVFAFTTSPSGNSSVLGFTTDTTSAEKTFGVSFTWSSTSVTAHLYANGSVLPLSLTALDARAVNFTKWAVQGGPVGEIQITNEAGTPIPDYTFTPTLVLDQSLNHLNALPDVTGQDVGRVLQDIATAEAGAFLFDEVGVAHFANRNTISSKASVREITSTESLVSLDTQEQMSLCATHIQVPYTPRSVQRYATVWNTGDTIVIGAASKYATIAKTSDSIVQLGTGCGIIPAGGLTAGSGYRAARYKDGSGGIIDNLVMTVSQLSPTQVYVTVRNPNPFPVWLVSPEGTLYDDSFDGQPRLAVGALPVTTGTTPDSSSSVAGGSSADSQWPDIDSGGAIANTQFGEILYQAPDSDWRQDADSAQDLADHLLSDLHYPKPLWRNVEIIPDPRLQLLDAVTITDNDVSKVNADGLIIGITTRLANSEYTQQIDVLALYRPGAWVLGESTLGVDNYLY